MICDVGTAHDGDFDRIRQVGFLGCFFGKSESNQFLVKDFLQFPEVSSVGRREVDLRRETQGRELRGEGVGLGGVDFVHEEHHRSAARPEMPGDVPIDGVETLAGVDHEKNQVGRGDRDIGLGPDLLGETVRDDDPDPPGVAEFVGDPGAF